MLNDYGTAGPKSLRGWPTARSALYHVILFLGGSLVTENWYARVDSNHRPFAPEAKSRCQRANSLSSRDSGRRVVGVPRLGAESPPDGRSAHSSAHSSSSALRLD